ncbi:hypothetical protein SELR_12720 [Selenomonas ruminantium subsp. lactilytica TAM6421]|uniref:Uncharacterized protein n=1 Tax=Selenomonas ruminantium subsp. lactilytica (strain NBRC 103574 / TAM6421) TaxID=927704 RepID=I0GQE3_SELRL|nr:hypothetical protein SELR_12720 [Selenomonas ruminantium subsp. lactilytica TAM6421]
MGIKIAKRQFGDIYWHQAALAGIGDIGVDPLFILGEIVRDGMKNAVYVINAFLADSCVILNSVTVVAQTGQGKKQSNYAVEGHNPGYIKFDIDK